MTISSVSLSYMAVKPLQFQAPTSSIDDIFLPNVAMPNLLTVPTLMQTNLGQSYRGSNLRRYCIEDHYHELVSGINKLELLFNRSKGY